MSTPSEQYFVTMMEQTWCISENEDAGVYKEQIKHLIQLMRTRLLDMSNNSQEEYVLKKLFKDFDSNESGTITVDELAAMMAKLGISVERKYLNSLLKTLDVNNSGMLEYEEFANFLINNPYK